MRIQDEPAFILPENHGVSFRDFWEGIPPGLAIPPLLRNEPRESLAIKNLQNADIDMMEEFISKDFKIALNCNFLMVFKKEF